MSDLNIPDIMARSEIDLGNALKRFRRHKKLTQRELGEKVGIRQATISSIEKGEPGTSLRTLALLLYALDLELVVKKRTKTDGFADDDGYFEDDGYFKDDS